MHRISKCRLFAWTVAIAAVAASPAMAELAQWDQARVTAIAKGLAANANAWEQAVRRQPGISVGSGTAQEEFGLLNRAQVLREQSDALAGHLAKGDGHDKTLDLYRSLKEMVDDTGMEAQRADLDEPTLDAWAKFADSMRQIAPYYDPKANADTNGSRSSDQ